MRHKKLPQETKTRVIAYLAYTWATSRGIDEDGILSSLPVSLREEVQISAHWQLIASVPLFQGCTENMVAMILQQLKTREYLPVGPRVKLE